jgi:hypothetical protein
MILAMKSLIVAGAIFATGIVIAAAQTEECAALTKNGDEVTMTAQSLRVVDSIANTLSRQYGIAVSAEEPKHEFAGNSEEMRKALPEWAAEHPTAFYVVPKREKRLELRFSLLPNGFPRDMRKLLEDFVHQANEEMTFGYRLDVDGEFFTLVPTTTRFRLGEIVSAMPMLDRKVTIPHGARPIAESANVMANALSLRQACASAVARQTLWAFGGA